MAKPIILTVDDDTEVLQAIARDVRQGFGEQFRVIRAESGPRALDVLRQIKLAGDAVALMLVDQRMPELAGVDLLAQARPLFPTAKRVLLTAYADTDAAIAAINDIQLDYYLIKPWDPPEQRLYPVLDDLLSDWMADYRPPFDGIRVIGQRWSSQSHAIRDFLARNQVPFQWLDLASDPHASELLALLDAGESDCPVVLFPDGTLLRQPTTEAVAEKLGLRGHIEVPLYDLAIIGAGPAGLAAGVYGASEGLKSVIIEREAAGGQAGMSSRIENYLGFPNGLSGGDLARRAVMQVRRFGTEMLLTQEAVSLEAYPGAIALTLADGTELRAHNIIIASGVSYRRMDVPGVDEFSGRGVYYGAGIAEATSIRGEDIYIVGGANSAGQAAVYFSGFARSVTMVVRGTGLAESMSHYLIERIEQTPNITVETDTKITEVIGTDHVEQLVLHNSKTGETKTVPATALFVFIGAVPRTDWLGDAVERDERGFILTGTDLTAGDRKSHWPLDRDPYLLETSIPGVMAAGDVRHGSGKRVATAVGEGAMAVMTAWQYRAINGL